MFYAFEKEAPHFDYRSMFFFINYALAAVIINYVLLGKFYYKKKYVSFFSGLILILLAVFLIEELVLEPFFYPNTKGLRLSNVFLTLLDIAPIIVILIGFKFALDALKKQNEVEALQSMAQESELKYLKSQINPHFLFNNLNNLYAHAIEESPRTPEIILELSSVLRYMLYDCKATYVPLSKEMEHLKSYINISELQIGERGEVTIHSNVDGNLKITPLILIVFIENAVKHSTASQSTAIQIHVEVTTDDEGWLHFQCVNSYHQQSNTESLSSGIGLSNVKKRLEILYADAHQLDILENGELYQVNLSMKLN
ncbi:MAG: histidine kinase [Chitinophagales bacterium]